MKQLTEADGNLIAGEYSCGLPVAPLVQDGPEDIYAFTCQQSGSVTVLLSGLDCDIDLYVLDEACDPNAGCIAGSTVAGTADTSVSFSCVAGDIYYVIVEGVGFQPPAGPDSCEVGEGNYELRFETGPGTGCPEDCNNGLDDDFDLDTDCADTDCIEDIVCLPEACDGIDNNEDGTIDEGFPDSDSDGVADCVDQCLGFDDALPCPIPAVSTWGLAVLALLLMTIGTVVLTNRRSSNFC